MGELIGLTIATYAISLVAMAPTVVQRDTSKLRLFGLPALLTAIIIGIYMIWFMDPAALTEF